MDAGTRPAQTLLTVAFAAVCCALAARGGIIMALAPRLSQETATNRVPPPPPRASAGAPRTLAPFPQLAPEQVEAPVETAAGGAGAIADPGKAKTGSGPLVPLQNATVVAITWFDVPELSLCSIVYNNEHTVHSINACNPELPRPCDKVSEGYRLVRIEWDRVFVLHEASGQEQELELYERRKKKKKAISALETEPEKPSEDTRGKGSAISQMMDNVKQVSPNHWEAPPGMRDDVLGRLNEVAMEGRWLPYFENGKIAGFKLAQTVPNSGFEKIGLKSGDVIRSVNGFDISSPDKMLDVFTKLKDARDISVDIQRGGGKKQTLQYTIN